jgi:hypothetical protein
MHVCWSTIFKVVHVQAEPNSNPYPLKDRSQQHNENRQKTREYWISLAESVLIALSENFVTRTLPRNTQTQGFTNTLKGLPHRKILGGKDIESTGNCLQAMEKLQK